MTNKPQILLILLLFFNIYTFPAYGEESYVYANIEANNLTISLNESRNSIGFGDIEIEAVKCSDGVLNLCFESESMLFALPGKGKTIINKNWTSMRSVSDQYLVLGSVLELDKIVITKSNGDVFTYWFSKKSGILFIKIQLKEISTFFVLKGHCGYGASIGCK